MPSEGLSTEATRLLAVLRAEADAAARAGRQPAHLTDQVLAERCSMPHRTVIDAAAELLAAGVLVLADGNWRILQIERTRTLIEP